MLELYIKKIKNLITLGIIGILSLYNLCDNM